MTRARLLAMLCIALFGCGGESAAFEPSETTGGEQAPTASAPAAGPDESNASTDSADKPEASPTPATDSPAQPPAAAAASAESPSPAVVNEAVAKPQGTPAAPPAKPDRAPMTKPSTPPAKAAGHAPASEAASAPQAALATPAAPATPPSTPPAQAAPATPAAQTPPPSTAGHVVVELRGLKSDSGKIQAALFRTEKGFPSEPNKAAVRKVVQIHDKKVDLSFDVDPPGTFVVLVHHDENGDSKMQTGALGQPAEGWGATRDPSANFGPPDFDDAKLTIKAGETKRVAIKMRY